MPPTRRSHILFDFFGTLVDYSASRTEQGYPGSHGLLRRLGAELDYPGFLAAWSQTMTGFDLRSDDDDHEFSMTEVGTAFLADVLGRRPAPEEVDAFVTEYVREWNTGVHYPAGVPELVRELRRDHRLAVVSNTHQPDLVPGHLAAMGLTSCFDVVITSVELGWRKPHPRIYAAALDALDIDADAAVFVGDTYGPDFVGPEPGRDTGVPHRPAAPGTGAGRPPARLAARPAGSTPGAAGRRRPDRRIRPLIPATGTAAATGARTAPEARPGWTTPEARHHRVRRSDRGRRSSTRRG